MSLEDYKKLVEGNKVTYGSSNRPVGGRYTTTIGTVKIPRNNRNERVVIITPDNQRITRHYTHCDLVVPKLDLGGIDGF